MTIKYSCALFLLFSVMTSCTPVESPFGYIFDGTTKQPLKGVKIAVLHHDKEVSTDKTGFFALKYKDNTAQLVLSLKGYETDTLPVVFQLPGEPKKYNFHGDTVFLTPARTVSVPRKQEKILPADSKWIGKYSVYAEGDATMTTVSSTTYTFEINPSGTNLTTTTVHDPIRCNGKYRIQEQNDQLLLFYDGDEPGCKSDSSSFTIKKEAEKFYIKGVGGEATFNEWVLMEKQTWQPS
jgi:hypothetical protein